MKFDIHCHLTSKEYESIKGAIDECERNNIILITNGLDYSDNEKVLELSKNYKNVYPSLGMHPTNDFDNRVISQIIKNKNEIVAIGEVGLDYKNGISKAQSVNFKKLIKLSQELNKPLIVHSRSAEKEVINELKTLKVPVILHCFTGKKKLLKDAMLNPNIYFSIPASIKYSEQFQALAKEVPINRLLCETDSPYLWKSGLNTPINVINSYEMIAKIKGLKLSDCEKTIQSTVKKVFKITEFKNN
ncbi:MAG: TatD family hydrolase [Candidatus Nanoarchaeia archaeon]|jgi:TatD DNase family protein